MATSTVRPCPNCEYCEQPKTWETTRYIKSKTFLNKDACISCYEKSDDGYEWDDEDDNDGCEDCEDGGYTHHYEDKRPIVAKE